MFSQEKDGKKNNRKKERKGKKKQGRKLHMDIASIPHNGRRFQFTKHVFPNMYAMYFAM